ncbi:unnamed protein product [Rodentolepis nana]|uniref:tRNA (adenine(58)-N(1))-methyltransferase n=1 Tax=Rodentolepis nana TaxID=102285 RepID=A0A0R3T7A6_RODNA|nr:unnamed protein product [Rodentolepis nana]
MKALKVLFGVSGISRKLDTILSLLHLVVSLSSLLDGILIYLIFPTFIFLVIKIKIQNFKLCSSYFNKLGRMTVLALDPAIWALSLPHRTQIIYPTDASMIVGQLDLVPGSRVLEAGTGSGALTHALAQAVWPSGHVSTFDFHEERMERARAEFEVCCDRTAITVSGLYFRFLISSLFPFRRFTRVLLRVIKISPQIMRLCLFFHSLGRIRQGSTSLTVVRCCSHGLRFDGLMH